MGRDKATIAVTVRPGGGQETLAARTAALLGSVCPATVEVGGGHTTLPAAVEDPRGAGPLAALVSGWRALAAGGWSGPALVVATDLPLLTAALLRWLADHPGSRSVVPVAGGRVQPLCARYSPADLEEAVRLVGRGERAVRALLAAIDAEYPTEAEWGRPAGGAAVLADVDTPEDLRRVTGP